MTDTQPDSLGHVTRYSDSSLYDEICVNCGAIDRGRHPNLSDPCPGKRRETHQPCPFFGVDCEYVAMVEAQAAEIERLGSVIDATARHWLALHDKHPIHWEGAIDGAMAAACAEIEKLREEVEQVVTGRFIAAENAIEAAAAEERAKIVAWLHEAGYRQIANKIEAKEYL
jgi:hypothetical protein